MTLRVKLKGYVTMGRFSIGHRHTPMTRAARCRFLWRACKRQFNRHYA